MKSSYPPVMIMQPIFVEIGSGRINVTPLSCGRNTFLPFPSASNSILSSSDECGTIGASDMLKSRNLLSSPPLKMDFPEDPGPLSLRLQGDQAQHHADSSWEYEFSSICSASSNSSTQLKLQFPNLAKRSFPLSRVAARSGGYSPPYGYHEKYVIWASMRWWVATCSNSPTPCSFLKNLKTDMSPVFVTTLKLGLPGRKCKSNMADLCDSSWTSFLQFELDVTVLENDDYEYLHVVLVDLEKL